MNLGAPELLILLLVVLLLFGASRLPKLAKSIGQASKEFKEGVKTGATPAELEMEPEETVTITKAELERLRAEQQRREAPPAV